jgi:hypothetical protein
MGYEDALLNIGGIGKGVLDKSVRDHKRIMIDDFETANILYNGLRKYLPLCQEGAVYSSIN